VQIPRDQLQLNIEEELEDVARNTIAELRNRWRELFRANPPLAFGPDLLRRRIAYHIQEKAFGGLSSSIRRELDQLVKVISRTSSGRIELPRRIKAGAVLVREWKGKTYRVTVIDEGFAYDGRSYGSLSEIAGEITGSNWNGPRFFGLRKSSASKTFQLGPHGAEVRRDTE
jgi:hypothetical protein